MEKIGYEYRVIVINKLFNSLFNKLPVMEGNVIGYN